jgi:uncharacterized protein (DUF433 family)
MVTDLLSRITREPDVMGGRPCIRGLRVTVGTILGLLASDHSVEEILAAYPYLERADVQAALSYLERAVETPTPQPGAPVAQNETPGLVP